MIDLTKYKIVDYIILSLEDLLKKLQYTEFEQLVLERINERYIPLGGVTFKKSNVHQTLVKVEAK